MHSAHQLRQTRCLQRAGAQPEKEAVDNRLQSSRSPGLDADAHRAAGFGGEPRGGRPRLWKVPQRRIVDWRVAEFRQVAHGAGVEINYRTHRGDGSKTI